MAQNSRPYELILFGATGYTGKLTAEWVSTNLPTDLRWAIAGRNAKKLQSVVDELTKLNPSRKQPGNKTFHSIHCRHSICQTCKDLQNGQNTQIQSFWAARRMSATDRESNVTLPFSVVFAKVE